MAKATASKKSAAPVKKVVAKAAPKKSIAKNTVKKKAPVKKVVAKKATPKKVAPKKVTAKKTPAKKVATKKIAVKKVTAKKIAVKKVVRKKPTKKSVEPELTITQIELANRAAAAITPTYEAPVYTQPTFSSTNDINLRLEATEPISRWRVWFGVFAITLGIFGVWIYSLQFTVLAKGNNVEKNQQVDQLVTDISESYTDLEDSVSNIKNRYEQLDTPNTNSTTDPQLNTDELDQLFSDLQ